jgi:hypothetical protein
MCQWFWWVDRPNQWGRETKMYPPINNLEPGITSLMTDGSMLLLFSSTITSTMSTMKKKLPFHDFGTRHNNEQGCGHNADHNDRAKLCLDGHTHPS